MPQYYKDIEDKDKRWYTMGNDFGNLRNDCDYILDIYRHKFGKSHSLSKKFQRLQRYIFIELASTLDSLICNSYESHIIYLPNYPEQIITGVFYSLSDEPIKRNLNDYSTLYSKKLSEDEKEFINKFIDNLNTYLSHLFNNNNYNLMFTLKKKINKINNYFNKIITNHQLIFLDQ